jgi:hypothetical protein
MNTHNEGYPWFITDLLEVGSVHGGGPMRGATRGTTGDVKEDAMGVSISCFGGLLAMRTRRESMIYVKYR